MNQLLTELLLTVLLWLLRMLAGTLGVGIILVLIKHIN